MNKINLIISLSMKTRFTVSNITKL